MSHFRYELGAKVRDRVTGIEGIVVCRLEWLYGCRRYVVQPPGSKDGKPYETSSFDEDALVLVTETEVENTVKDTGGSREMPTRGPKVTR